jgi:hypothetical protein
LFGIDLDNFDEYLHVILRKYNLDLNIENLRFYIEYMLFMISNCNTTEDEQTLQMSFFSDVPKASIIKKRILIMSKIRLFNSKMNRTEYLKFLLEKYFRDVNGSKGSVEKVALLCENMIKCFPLLGYCNILLI